MRKTVVFLWLVLFLLLWGNVQATAQTNVQLRLSQPDISDFPSVQLNLLTADSRGAPLPESELDNLTLRENGVPISSPDVRFVPVGIDAILVLDADASLELVDAGSEQTRLQQVQASVERFAARFMNPSGLDRVSVIVPDSTGAAPSFLLMDEGSPEAVTSTLQSYAPDLPETAPVNEMLAQAIEYAAEIQEDGRFQAILLFTEARRLHQFLDYTALVEAAQSINLPIYVAILGGQASLDELDNAAGLYQPTRADYVHMPQPADTDPIYLIWQRQSNQAQITYQSLLRQSGRYPISVGVAGLTAMTELNLTIAPPQISWQLAEPVVRRAGIAPDTPLAELQPTVQPLPLQITWPDDLPRRLTTVTFTVNDQPQPFTETPQPDENGQLLLDWNVQQADVGAYELAVEIEDELGYTAVTEPQIVTIEVNRPPMPTATPAPTATPPPISVIARVTEVPRNDLLLILAGLGLLGILLVMIRWWRQYRRRAAISAWVEERRAQRQTAVAEADEPETQQPLSASLELLEDAPGNVTMIPLEDENVAFGRDPEIAGVVFSSKTVSRLHARIRRRDNQYWLYDEGSAAGTFLNHERLGLSPKRLQDQDEIRLGQVGLRFHLRPVEEEEDNT